jgi:arabinofuranosyltransferase
MTAFARWLCSERARGRHAGVTLAVLALLIVTCQVRLAGDFRVDDAYISFAFAKNLAHGNGLVFSHDLRVEGYTNFLWTVLMALPIWLWPDLDPLIAARALCFASLAGLLLASYRLSRLFAAPVFAAATVLCLAAWTDLTRAALSGLETVPHAMLLAFGTLAYLRERDGERSASLWWFAAAALTRISSMLHVAFMLAFDLGASLARRKLALGSLLRWAVPPLIVLTVYFAWRYRYYGLPLPTTYYAKSLVAASDPDRGARYLWDALRDLGVLALLPIASAALARRFDRKLAFLIGAVLFEASYVVHVGGDWMPFNRFCVPMAAPLLALFAAGMSEIWKLSAGAVQTRFAAAVLLCAALGWLCIHADAHRVDTPQERAKLASAAHLKRHTYEDLYRVRSFFNAILRRPGEVLVTDYGGVVGYYTDASIIEMWGLCNREIALRGNVEGINPIYGKTCIECYQRFDPDYFHIMTPIVRDAAALRSHRQVISQIFQGRALDRALKLRERYATGRVLEPGSRRALFFIEKRRPGVALAPRPARGGFIVDYPFEPGGAAVL